MNKEELIRLIREDEEVQQAVLDMLAENVTLRADGFATCVRVSLRFGERSKTTDWGSDYNANLLEDTAYL